MNKVIRYCQYVIREQWLAVATMVAVICFSFVLIATYKSYRDLESQHEIIAAETKLLKNRVDTLKYNKLLTQDEVATYNKILALLIPESEDFFSIIYALEEISANSGFKIVGYTINLSDNPKEKLSIGIEGKGDAVSFMRFLDSYPYEGKRLITSDKIEYSGTGFSTTKMTLNLYHKKFVFNEKVAPQLTPEEVKKLRDIQSKINIQFANESETGNGEYEAGGSPF